MLHEFVFCNELVQVVYVCQDVIHANRQCFVTSTSYFSLSVARF